MAWRGMSCAVLALVAAAAATAQGPVLEFWPMGARPGHDVEVGSYFDHHPDPCMHSTPPAECKLDYRCDWRGTYNGHRGSDGLIRGWRAQDAGIPLFAAVSGTVTSVVFGHCDKCKASAQPSVKCCHDEECCSSSGHLACCTPSSSSGSGTSNGVSIDHGGYSTWYGHMRKDVMAEPGQPVHAGQQIGWVGTSGGAVWPHVHFQLKCGTRIVDPFGTPQNPTQECMPAGQSTSYWATTPAFKTVQFRIFDLGVTSTDPAPRGPAPSPYPEGGWIADSADEVFVWSVVLFPVFTDITATYRVYSPASEQPVQVVVASPVTNTDRKVQSFHHRLDLSSLPHPLLTGTWTIEIELALVGGPTLPSAAAPVLVASAPPGNRPPNPISAVDVTPAAPDTGAALRCEVDAPLVGDPDYDLPRYRYVWSVASTGEVKRDMTHAGRADMLPCYETQPGQEIRCTVTVTDGLATGNTLSDSVIVSTTDPVTPCGVAPSVTCPPETAGRWYDVAPEVPDRGRPRLVGRGELVQGGQARLEVRSRVAGGLVVWMLSDAPPDGSLARATLVSTLNGHGRGAVTLPFPASTGTGRAVYAQAWVLDPKGGRPPAFSNTVVARAR